MGFIYSQQIFSEICSLQTHTVFRCSMPVIPQLRAPDNKGPVTFNDVYVSLAPKSPASNC